MYYFSAITNMNGFYRNENKVCLWWLIAILLTCTGVSICQSQNDGNKLPLPPKEEKFQASTDLLIPWREASCWYAETPQNSVCQRGVTAKLQEISTTLNLYDEDGTIWKTLDLSYKQDDFNKAYPDIVPFATPGADIGRPTWVVLRMAAESPSWYKVIVNEDSGQVKYAYKNAVREWAPSTFDHFFYRTKTITFYPDSHPLLYDSPNGKVIDDPVFAKETDDRFINLDKPDGEWMYVRYGGWIRWREGRKFLVACAFTNNPFLISNNRQ